MPVKKPSVEQLSKIAQKYHLELTKEDLEFFQSSMSGAIESYDQLEKMVQPNLPVKYPRTTGYRPEPEENLLNAWYYKTSIKGKETGKLANKRIAIKDNVSVAGVPMMVGSSVLEGFVPNEDATIITRILDEGGEIVGKTVTEDLCLSGASHTSKTDPVLNPQDKERSSGGSSSGSAAVVAADEADLAIGGDQGGSIRIPASWTGTVGLKPTYGLVPYTGIMPIELTLDHTGPMGKTVEDVALFLEVLAGADGLDPRQNGTETTKSYTEALTGDAAGIKVGILQEGFGWEGVSEDDVDQSVLQAAQSLEKVGANVEDVSIPMHRNGVHIWNGIGIEGLTSLMIRGNGYGTNWKGYYSTKFIDQYGQARKSRANDYSETVKMTMLIGEYMRDKYNGRYYAIAQNMALKLKEAYNQSLQKYDVLILPTTPMKATKIPKPDASREEYMAKALEMIQNTAPTNITGHPAISVPCGYSEGLPVGMMVVGRHGEDETILRVAHAFQVNSKNLTSLQSARV